MNDQSPNLVARAAARLRQTGATRSTPAPAPPVAQSAVAQSLAAPPAIPADLPKSTPQYRSKLITVDRGALARTGASVDGGAPTRTSEEFRIIKRQIVLNARSQPNVDEGERSGRLIMVTSTKPREGKTFTAVNLALSLASEQDLRVLLIDLDAHRKSLTETFGISAELGLVDLLADSAVGFPDVLLRTNVHNLSLLPVGRAAQDLPELLSSKRTAALLTEMTQRYPDRFIIFDSPPCLASSEPSILAGLVGQIVFVVEAHKTEREEIEAALRLISGCSNISLVLNKADTRNLEEFGSYSTYYAPEGRPS
jgi:protein-tyrosine kinase